VIPANYTCLSCKAGGCKLWRVNANLLLNPALYCGSCALKVERLSGEITSTGSFTPAGLRTGTPRTAGIGKLIPAHFYPNGALVPYPWPNEWYLQPGSMDEWRDLPSMPGQKPAVPEPESLSQWDRLKDPII